MFGGSRMEIRSEALFATSWVLLSAVVVLFGSEYASQQLGLIYVYGLLALSFTYVWGIGGVFSLCQSALFGVGAYTYGIISINFSDIPSAGFAGLLMGMVGPAILAAAFGWFIFFGRLSGMYVAVATLALDLAMLTFMNGTASPDYSVGQAALGGQNGMVGIMPLSFGASDVDDGFSNRYFLIFVSIVNLLVTIGVWWSLRTRWLTAILAIRDNELRARTLGFDSRFYRLGVFVVGAGLAGLAGAEYAAQQMFVSTSVFGLPMAALVIIWVLLGGKRSVPGAYVGVGLMQLLVLSLAGTGSDIEVFASGLIMILAVTFLPDGVLTIASRLNRLRPVNGRRGSIPYSAGAQNGPIEVPVAAGLKSLLGPNGRSATREQRFTVHQLYKSFGGVSAVTDLSLEFDPASITCIVGPNGAGKSTLFNLISGKFETDRGTLILAGTDITRRQLEDRIELGVSVKYQVSELFRDLTVRQHLKLAIWASHRHLAWGKIDDIASDWEGFFGLQMRSRDIAADLAHGDAQKLDIAMAISCQPSLLLLDEPTAGLNPEEIRRLEQVIKTLGDYMTVLVITHDFAFVSRLNSRVVVMSQGGLFGTGSVDELKKNDEFIELYLGKRGATFEH